jgi:hypothetical protein
MRNCPLCGAPANWSRLVRVPWAQAADAHGWDRHEYTVFGSGVVRDAVYNGASYEKRRPVRAASVASDVVVPVLQSVVSGVVVGGVASGIAALTGAGWAALLWGMGVGTAGLGLAWLMILREHRSALWEIERITGKDLDGDGHTGRSVQKRGDPVTVEVVQRDERGRLRHIQWLHLPPTVTDDTLTRLATAVLLNGREFSRRKLPDGMLSPDQYSAVKDAMLKGGLLRYKGKGEQAGVELTGPGRAFLRQYL